MNNVKIEYHKENGKYICDETFIYFSDRYYRSVTVRKGFKSDGATGAKDIKSNAWWVHDVVSRYNKFDDGFECTVLQSSFILHDILKSEGFYISAKTWFVATLIGRHIDNLWCKLFKK